MGRYDLVFGAFFCVCLQGVLGKILDVQPEYIKTCYITKPKEEFVKCSTDAVQTVFSALSKGNEEIGLQELDPLKIPIINIHQGGGGPVKVNASLTDVTLTGLGDIEIKSNSFDPETYDFYTKIHLPKLRIEGDYDLMGKVLFIPIKGKGTCWFDASEVELDVKSFVIMQKHDGFDFFHVTKEYVKLSIGGLKMNLDNLFDGNKSLEKTTNAFLNSHWKLVVGSLNPIISKTVGDILLNILQKVMDNVPANFFLGDLAENDKRIEANGK